VADITIGIVAGEASGDALAATLIRAVRSTHPHVRFVGVAGPQMEAAGCEAWYSVEQLAVRGLLEVIRHLPRLFFLRRRLRLRFLDARVPLFIGVDAPDFNLGLEARLKRSGARCVHFVSPSVWAWRRERVHKIALDGSAVVSPEPGEDLVALDDALRALAAVESRQAKVVELRFFGGMTEEETADLLEISTDTVLRDWKKAKLWLWRELRYGKKNGP